MARSACVYAALESAEADRFGGRGRHGLSESISSPVRTPCSDRTTALTIALTHVQFSGLERVSLQFFR